MNNQDLWRLGAVELAAQIRQREVSALQATLPARVAAQNPRVNALVDLIEDLGLQAGEIIERAAHFSAREHLAPRSA